MRRINFEETLAGVLARRPNDVYSGDVTVHPAPSICNHIKGIPMRVHQRLLTIVQDTMYDYVEIHRATRIDPAEGVLICTGCERQEGDEHEEECRTGIIEEWICDHDTNLDYIKKGIIRDYETEKVQDRIREERKLNQVTEDKQLILPGFED